MADNGNNVLDGLYSLAKSIPSKKAQAKAYLTTIIGTIASATTAAWADITGKPTLVEEAPIDTTAYVRKDAGWVSAGSSSYSDENAQDAVGTILTDTATIDFTYTDAAPTIEASVKAASITEAMQVLADNTTNNVSITKHGYVPKAPNLTTQFLRGDGTWAALVLSGLTVVNFTTAVLINTTPAQMTTTVTFA
jgi:hypothetical protein